MQILPAAVATAVAILQLSSPTPKIVRSDPVLVRAVVDGDTIDVVSVGRVRLLGIDAPELGRGFDTAAPFAKEARDRLVALVLHRWIRLEQEGQALDAYSRHLAYVLTEDGVFVNAVLVRDGLARISARTPLSRLPDLQRAEAEAQAFRRGMWGSTPQVPATGYTRPSGTSHKQPAQHAKKKKSK
jgi:endonuclease YncB( thermonuclease family)